MASLTHRGRREPRCPPAGRLLLLAALVACAEDGRGGISGIDEPPVATGPMVSDPVAHGTGAAVHGARTAAAFVSLPPGTRPLGEVARLRVDRTGATVVTAMSSGGFDPIPLPAVPGDTVLVEITVSGSAATDWLALEVPPETPPKVVRTRPVRGKRDVYLNDVIVVVFSEPVDPGTLTGTTVWLEHAGARVEAVLTPSPTGTVVELRPAGNLAPNTDYALRVSGGVRDLQGDYLEPEFTSTFRTGTGVAAGSAAVSPAGLTTLFNGQIRTFQFEAVVERDGSVSGWFRGYNPTRDFSWSGRVTCLTIVEGRTAWVAGVLDQDSSGAPGAEVAWKAVDLDGSGGEEPDRLSLMLNLTANGLGTAAEYCAETPDLGIGLVPIPLTGGDVSVVAPSAGPPVRLAFTTPPVNAAQGWPLERVTVAALDAEGRIATGFSGPIHVALAPNAAGATLGGATAITARAGVADFVDLSVAGPPGSYGLLASAGGLAEAGSPPFEIVRLAPGRIAFYSRFPDQDERDGLYVVAWNGTGLSRISSAPDSWPSWSPGGSRIAVERAGEPAIYVMNADGSDARRVHAGMRPVWSPDGSRIAFWSDHEHPGLADIYVMNADGSLVRPVTTFGAASRPAWSPDGEWLAFVANQDTTYDLYKSRVDGSELTRLTRLPSCAEADEPAWSPDGSTIAFNVTDYPAAAEACPIELRGIYLVDADGRRLRRLSARWSLDEGVAWSPDGTQLASLGYFDLYGTCGSKLTVRRVDGTGVVRLTSEGCVGPPAWTGVPQN